MSVKRRTNSRYNMHINKLVICASVANTMNIVKPHALIEIAYKLRVLS